MGKNPHGSQRKQDTEKTFALLMPVMGEEFLQINFLKAKKGGVGRVPTKVVPE